MSFPKCEFCGGNKFEQLPRTFVLVEKDTVKSILMGPLGNIDVMVRICDQCGHISLFSKAIIERGK